MQQIAGQLTVLASLVILSACQTNKSQVYTSINTHTKPEPAVASIARVAQKCWFKSGDATFKPYRMANEISSFSGQPRFLLVPHKKPGGLPLLVVQAQQKGDATNGKYTNITIFGSLLDSKQGNRILKDINRWSGGQTSCG